MKSVGSYEAKTHLPRLLDRVGKGERFTITKHGVPIAKLIPVEDEKPLRIGNIIKTIQTFRKGHTLRGISIKQLITQGRR